MVWHSCVICLYAVLCMYCLGYSLNIRSKMPCEVIVCNLGHHDAIGCYDANELVEIEKGMWIIIMRLQH